MRSDYPRSVGELEEEVRILLSGNSPSDRERVQWALRRLEWSWRSLEWKQSPQAFNHNHLVTGPDSYEHKKLSRLWATRDLFPYWTHNTSHERMFHTLGNLHGVVGQSLRDQHEWTTLRLREQDLYMPKIYWSLVLSLLDRHDLSTDHRYLWDIFRNCFIWRRTFLRHQLSEWPIQINLDENNRLHRTDGPAISFKDGAEIFCWHGLEIPRRVVLQPNLVTLQDVFTEPNLTRRWAMLDIIGPSLINSGQAQKISEDPSGILWEIYFGVAQDPYCLVEVINATAEKDGSFRHYFIRVPPLQSSPREAIAWSFSLSSQEYRPNFQT